MLLPEVRFQCLKHLKKNTFTIEKSLKKCLTKLLFFCLFSTINAETTGYVNSLFNLNTIEYRKPLLLPANKTIQLDKIRESIVQILYNIVVYKILFTSDE